MSSEASARFFILFYDGSRVFAVEQKEEKSLTHRMEVPDHAIFGDVNSRSCEDETRKQTLVTRSIEKPMSVCSTFHAYEIRQHGQ